MGKTFKGSIRASAAALIALGAVTCASGAYAACGDEALAQHASWQDNQAASLFHRAAVNSFGTSPIVGMWSFTMTSGGQTADFGYQQWHSDGTELMNSGGRAPASENFCMGVWRQVSTNRFHLNHLALSYDPSSGTLNARVNIKEDVTVNPAGTSYSGTFTLDVYDPSGKTAVAHQSGQVTAQRVPAN